VIPVFKNANMEITRIGSRASGRGPEDWFTGSVRIDPLFDANNTRRAVAATVTFEPGARTAWHTHPLGQTLIVLSGVGWVQKSGAAIEEVYPGDIIWIEANEKHWHGATATNGMSHIAIHEDLDGKVVDWLEKVTEEQYSRFRTTK
jgi:quercetin dioxygenase-like cupin family protein